MTTKAPTSTPKNKTRTTGALEVVVARNHHVKLTAQYALRILVGAAIVGALLLMSLLYVLSREADVAYIAIAPDNTLLPLQTLDRPLHSDAVVSSWVAKCIIESYTFSYVDYKERLNAAIADCYSESGAESLRAEIIKQKIVQTITNENLHVSLVLTRSPIVVQKMLSADEGVYAWRLGTSAQLSFRSGKKSYTENIDIHVEVVRVSVNENIRGIGIRRIIIRKKA